nr:FGGY family carbohydrate kinase [Nocardioides flavescens]
MWDRDTLGSPRPAVTAPGGPVEALRWVAEHEPHTWRLVEEDTYALGGLDSYLLARLTRGTYHLTDPSQAEHSGLYDAGAGAWSEERCRAAGVPVDALPELTAPWGRIADTEPGASGGLDVPVTALLSTHRAGELVGGDPALGTAYAAGLGLGWWGTPEPTGLSPR